MNYQKLAKDYIEVIPRAMDLVRKEMRLAASEELTIAQFRTMALINAGTDHICDLANLHGVSQPAMSRLIEYLVQKNLVARTDDSADRRNKNITLTEHGKEVFADLRMQAAKSLASKFKENQHFDYEKLLYAIEILQDYIKVIKE